jgi:hypothetical protein
VPDLSAIGTIATSFECREKQRYELKAFGTGFAYQVKPDAKGANPSDMRKLLCTRKEIVFSASANQYSESPTWNGDSLPLSCCKTEIQI